MLILGAFAWVGYSMLHMQPAASDEVGAWLAKARLEASELERSFPPSGVHLSWMRRDTYLYTATEIAELERQAAQHPQATARATIDLVHKSQTGEGLVARHELWSASNRFRHNTDTPYLGQGEFIDICGGPDGGWSFGPDALTLLPAASSGLEGSRRLQGAVKIFKQDVLGAFTGRLEELERLKAPEMRPHTDGDRWSCSATLSDNPWVAELRLEGRWDAERKRGFVDRLSIKNKKGETSVDSFAEWVEEGGHWHARSFSSDMPDTHHHIDIASIRVEPVSEDEVTRVCAPPQRLSEQPPVYRDAVRGDHGKVAQEISLRQETPSVKVMRPSGPVQAELQPPPEDHSGSIKRLGWVLGGLVAVLIAMVVIAQRRHSS
ncbi:MAG: hypothetical protein K2Q09_05820 [Phycisphaerales bacterium]|nr:hypothetical protein [Phycisphaerales bacterium]